MAKFARLIEVSDDQVLLMVTYNDDTDRWETSIISEFQGYTATLKAGFTNEESARQMMNEFTLESAIKFRDNLVNEFSG